MYTEFNLILLTQPDLALLQHIISAVEFVGLEITKTIRQQLLGFLGAGIITASPHHHGNQTHVVTYRRSGQTETGSLGMTGFQTIDGGITPQQLVAVGLANIVVFKIFFGIQTVIVRMILDDMQRQRSYIPCA